MRNKLHSIEACAFPGIDFPYVHDVLCLHRAACKLHLPHPYNSLAFAGKDGMPGKYESKTVEMALFDMEKDTGETTNVLRQFPQVVERLKGFAEQHRRQFYGD